MFYCLRRRIASRRPSGLPRRAAGLLINAAVLMIPALSYGQVFATRTAQAFGPFVEYELTNISYAGNPFDLVATATFVHPATGQSLRTGLFYVGNDRWRFRFTATERGIWNFSTASNDSDLAGHSGSINVNTTSSLPGFIVANGTHWARTNSDQVTVPQLVMGAGPHYYAADPSRISSAIDVFVRQHGFTGLHIPVFCRWFDINQKACNSVGNTDPDLATFEVLDQLLRQSYAAGAAIHFWTWGDSDRFQNPLSLAVEGGVNGIADRRLQRYIAARLGPLPGWTMGYGFDLFEWSNTSALNQWRSRIRSESGWQHLLGARSATNLLSQLSESMDYSAYEQHRPDFDDYVAAHDARRSKPSFSEDRFRYRGNSQRTKDYTFIDMRRGVWRSYMAGGVANIWGNLADSSGNYLVEINEGEQPSRPFPNPQWFKTAERFFADRFVAGMSRCSLAGGNARCLRAPDGSIYVYVEDSRSVAINLPSVAGGYTAAAVRTLLSYTEVSLGTVASGSQTLTLPAISDWGVILRPGGSNQAPPPDQLAPAAPSNLQLSIP